MKTLKSLEKKNADLIKRLAELNKEFEQTIVKLGQEQKDNQYKSK